MYRTGVGNGAGETIATRSEWFLRRRESLFLVIFGNRSVGPEVELPMALIVENECHRAVVAVVLVSRVGSVQC